jgi:peptide/nickel transport system permease protein
VSIHALLFRRTLQLAAVAFLAVSVTFLLASLIPGDFFTLLEADPTINPDTIKNLRRQYGLGEPIHLQYFHWLQRSFQLDLGYSLFYGRPVAEVIGDALVRTLWLGTPALFFGLLAGILTGTLHALHRNRMLGYSLDVLSTSLLSLPSLVLGLLAILLASHTQWFPVGGASSADFQYLSITRQFLDRLHHLALPALCLALPIFAWVERIQYSSVRAFSDELYLRSAHSRGLSRSRIFFQYLVRPSLNPILSAVGPLFAGMLSISLVLEYIFLWPGLGRVTYDALINRDIFLLLGSVMCGSVLLVAANLAADLLLFALDPRTRESTGRML